MVESKETGSMINFPPTFSGKVKSNRRERVDLSSTGKRVEKFFKNESKQISRREVKGGFETILQLPHFRAFQ